MAWTSRTREVLGRPVRWLGLASIRTLYDVLGVRRDADPETIKQAFRRAVKAHHPDLSGDEPAASEKFHDIIAASEVLRDPEQRAVYDRQLALERELSQLAFRDALVRAALATMALALVVIGGAEVWIALTGSPAREARSTHSGADVATMSEPDQRPQASGGRDAHAAAGPRSEPDPMPPPATREAADDSAGPDAGIDSSMLSDSFAALPSPPPASSAPEPPIDTISPAGPDPDIAELDETLRLAPNDAQAHRRRANLWGRKGDMDRALADYDEAIRIDPGDIAIFHDRGVMWQRNGELDKALVDLDRAVRMSFADPEVYSDRGAVWFEKGRYDRALADFNQALKIDPRLASASTRRAAALDRKGEQDRSRAARE
ncbi:MAG TPA: DnaJ domain-containing protein [Bradyrhizobium sp.]|nr:DnaJ domain-containing protein [Bradyrhizobium sp.]